MLFWSVGLVCTAAITELAKYKMKPRYITMRLVPAMCKYSPWRSADNAPVCLHDQHRNTENGYSPFVRLNVRALAVAVPGLVSIKFESAEGTTRCVYKNGALHSSEDAPAYQHWGACRHCPRYALALSYEKGVLHDGGVRAAILTNSDDCEWGISPDSADNDRFNYVPSDCGARAEYARIFRPGAPGYARIIRHGALYEYRRIRWAKDRHRPPVVGLFGFYRPDHRYRTGAVDPACYLKKSPQYTIDCVWSGMRVNDPGCERDHMNVFDRALYRASEANNRLCRATEASNRLYRAIDCAKLYLTRIVLVAVIALLAFLARATARECPRSPLCWTYRKLPQPNDKVWYSWDGYVHRCDGPAIVRADGTCEWWHGGRQVMIED